MSECYAASVPAPRFCCAWWGCLVAQAAEGSLNQVLACLGFQRHYILHALKDRENEQRKKSQTRFLVFATRRYAAIFDADFEPPVDFLEETIPHLHTDRKLGFVQTRWLNPSSSFLTWAQARGLKGNGVQLACVFCFQGSFEEGLLVD